MAHPAVDTILSAIKSNWSAGSYADIPLERVNRDDSDQLDDSIRSHTEDLQADNYVGVSYADRTPTPIGTEYDSQTDVTVNVRIEGLHVSEHGYVNPSNSLPPSSAGDPVPWTPLVKEIRAAIEADRTFPSTGEADIDYTSLVVRNENPLAYEYGDYYRHDFDVVFEGYEEL